jgi:hypothetical protein
VEKVIYALGFAGLISLLILLLYSGSVFFIGSWNELLDYKLKGN